MEQCEFCGANLPANAGFCGRCGRTPRRSSQQATSIANVSTLFGEDDISKLPTMSLESLSDEQKKEEEEERRRRAALLGFGVPLLGELAGQQPLGQIPAVQGTPQIQQIASLQGTPQLQRPDGHVFGSGSPAGPGIGLPLSNPFQPGPISHFPVSPPHPPSGLTLGDADFPGPKHGGSGSPGSGSSSPGPKPGSSGGSGASKGSPSGCLVGIIVIVVCILLILGSIVGLGLTVWAPSLALSGSASVAPGGTLALHGSGFLPNSSVTLILDSNIPLYYVERNAASQLADKYLQTADSAGQMLLQASNGHSNILPVRGDGTFAVSFQIDLSWSLGRHTIHASESPTHRSAALSFTILQGNSTVTPSPTQSITPPPGVTPTATVTSTTPPSLSCASPANLALGPVSEYSSQAISNSITLCTNGSGMLTWNASWNAAWLSLSQKSGSIQAPNQAQITATAVATNMAAGNYSTTITFTNTQDKTTQAVTVSFTVQVGCVNATPPRMVFSGVANMSDPTGSQTIKVTNCGLTSGWSVKVRNGSKWLSTGPSGGTLNGGATGSVTVTASNLGVGLQANSYIDFVDITIGSKTSSVTVVLDVQPQPMISVSPTSLYVYTDCTYDANNGGEDCPVTLSDSSSSLNLTWTWSASASAVSVNAPNGTTIGAGGSEGITIVFTTPCDGVPVTVTFIGPGPNNAATVTYTCQRIT